MERSKAIKCPTAAYQVVGTKKMQQIFSETHVLDKYLDSQDEVHLIKQCFTGLYSLDPSDQPKIIPTVLKNHNKYVMKPQREGGGNLLTNDEMVKALQTLPSEEIASYIIMDRINPKEHDCLFVRHDSISVINAVSELGIFGIYVGDGTNEYYNEVAGYLLRTKASDKEDGGVAAGVAVIDSIFLIN